MNFPGFVHARAAPLRFLGVPNQHDALGQRGLPLLPALRPVSIQGKWDATAMGPRRSSTDLLGIHHQVQIGASAYGSRGRLPAHCGAVIAQHAAMDFAWIQWPAMVVTVGATWLVASREAGRRRLGFWIFLLSNGLWIVWGMDADAWGLISLQVCLAVMNVRGACRQAKAGT